MAPCLGTYHQSHRHRDHGRYRGLSNGCFLLGERTTVSDAGYAQIAAAVAIRRTTKLREQVTPERLQAQSL